MEAKYNARHAQEILKPCGVLENLLLLDDKGVWPAVERDMLMQAETEMLRWRPARELQSEPGAPEVSDTPMLPIPFTARELTAFMLDGAGALVADFYGNWENGPDSQSLNHIDPDSRARMALVEAFAAYRLTQELVGKWDIELQNKAHALQREYSDARDAALEREKVMERNDIGLPEAEYLAEYRRRLKLAVDPLAELDAEAGRVNDEAKDSFKSWLSAMVCALLNRGRSASLEAEPATDVPKKADTQPQQGNSQPVSALRSGAVGWGRAVNALETDTVSAPPSRARAPFPNYEVHEVHPTNVFDTLSASKQDEQRKQRAEFLAETTELTPERVRNWLAMDSWTLDQAHCLLIGFDWNYIQLLAKHVGWDNPIFSPVLSDIFRQHLCAARDRGVLKFPAAPADVIRWADCKGLRLPQLLLDYAASLNKAVTVIAVPIATPEPQVGKGEAAPIVQAPASKALGSPAQPVVAVGAPVLIHSTKARRDTLTPVIELAQEHCRNPQDTAEVWAVLQGLAERKSPPLIGATENGLQYLKNGTAENFNRQSLRKRLAR